MTAPKEINQKIKAHLIEHPEDKSSDIAEVFGVPVSTVYDAKESLRRHKMLPRAHAVRKKIIREQKAKVQSIAPVPTTSYELATLRAEIARLNAIIDYLETAAGIKKAA